MRRTIFVIFKRGCRVKNPDLPRQRPAPPIRPNVAICSKALFSQLCQREVNTLPLNSRRSPSFQRFRTDVNNLVRLFVVMTGETLQRRPRDLSSPSRDSFAMAVSIEAPQAKA
ncbi:MAG TPA: hypothetical protein VMF50_06600 [Candidatus Binataceae bacterium]|nr:hypothetical protein [Candidatus Binataceae bacterium]